MLAVTGANGHLGVRLLHAGAHRALRAVAASGAPGGRYAEGGVRALVRSQRAAAALNGRPCPEENVDVRVVDYADRDELTKALDGCAEVIHLVGIVRESAASRYEQAHQGTCRALAGAAERAGVRRIVYLSIVGASAEAGNACLVSKAAAERLLLDAAVPATVIRLPMVLGEDDFAARALGARARRSWNLVVRGASLEQPIYAGDVVAAVMAALRADRTGVYDLAGPECLPRSQLIRRAARMLGRGTRVLSLPLWSGMAAALVLEKLLADPPLTRAMLGVLDHDDRIDVGPALEALGLTLTSLDETLRRCLSGSGAER